MTIIEITVDDFDVSVKGYGEGMCSPSERKVAAVIIAAVDGIARGLETGEYEKEAASVIRPTIQRRMAEAGLVTP